MVNYLNSMILNTPLLSNLQKIENFYYYLKNYYVDKIDLDRLSEKAYYDPSSNGNPRKLTVMDMKTLYQHSITGQLF